MSDLKPVAWRMKRLDEEVFVSSETEVVIMMESGWIADLVYAIPDTHRVVSVEMLEGIVTTLMTNGYFCGDIRAIIDNKGEI